MEELAAGEESKARGEEAYFLYSPCYCFHRVVKAVLKCLGYESAPHEKDADPPHREAQKITTEAYEVRISSARVKRPPIKGGRGGQTN